MLKSKNLKQKISEVKKKHGAITIKPHFTDTSLLRTVFPVLHGPLHFQPATYRHTVNADTFYSPLSVRVNRVSQYIEERFCLLFTIFPVSPIIQLDCHPKCCITPVFFLFLLAITVVPEDHAYIKFLGINNV